MPAKHTRLPMKTLSFLLLVIDWSVQSDIVLVNTPNGDILGRRENIGGVDLDVFLGIPFAKPPVGTLRFKLPEPYGPFSSAWEAFDPPPSCYQPRHSTENYANGNVSEDCLYLNLIAPSRQRDDLSTIVLIHGGSFEKGSITSFNYDPRYLARRGNVIVVSMNYRLGSLGFLDLGIDDCPGNMGLYDQNLALQWVNRNIRNFGGHPDKVTIYGSSAGAISAGFHISSPLSAGLFKRAILESGVPNVGYFGIRHNAKKSALKHFYTALDCPPKGQAKSASSLLRCLHEKSPAEIIVAEEKIAGLNRMTFSPSFNGRFFAYKSIFDFSPSFILPQDIMIGVTKDEGSHFTALFASLFRMQEELDKRMVVNIIRKFLGLSETLPPIVDYYFAQVKSNRSSELRSALQSFIDHIVFKCPSYYFANVMAEKGANVFFYYFTHLSQHLTDFERKYFGVAHNSDEPYFLGQPHLNPDRYTDTERDFSDQMMDLIVTFAENGKPSSDRHYCWPSWTRDPGSLPYDQPWTGHQAPLALELNAEYSRLIPFPEYDVCTRIWPRFFYPGSYELSAFPTVQ